MTHARYETLLLEKPGAIATLTLNRPGRMNGMTNRMVAEATEALTAIAADPDVRVLVLTGAGRAFSPGADLQAVASSDTPPDGELRPEQFRAAVLLREMPAVTIAAINGACAGAAFGWAAACDLRFAAASAKFNVAFLDVGVAGDMGGPWTLPRLLGSARARDLYFLPGKFDAEEALRIGFVSRVFPDERFRDEVAALATRLVESAPIALRTMKQNFLDAERMTFAEFIQLETERHLPMFRTEDTMEAFRARVEKRKPKFVGR
jgi:2-(1,2-epoxy-1,2-dihydrophenyl)acetyl-CoA isomerase